MQRYLSSHIPILKQLRTVLTILQLAPLPVPHPHLAARDPTTVPPTVRLAKSTGRRAPLKFQPSPIRPGSSQQAIHEVPSSPSPPSDDFADEPDPLAMPLLARKTPSTSVPLFTGLRHARSESVLQGGPSRSSHSQSVTASHSAAKPFKPTKRHSEVPSKCLQWFLLPHDIMLLGTAS